MGEASSTRSHGELGNCRAKNEKALKDKVGPVLRKTDSMDRGALKR